MIPTLANKTLVKNMLTCKTGLLDHFAEDGEWIIVGSTRWSGTYRAKSAIGMKLLAPLSAEIENLGVFVIDNVVAEAILSWSRDMLRVA